MRAVKLDAFGARLHAIHMQNKKSANVNVVVNDSSESLVKGETGVDTSARANAEPTLGGLVTLPDDTGGVSEYDDDDDDDDDGLGSYEGDASTASAFEVNSVPTDCRTCGYEPLPADSSVATLANEIDMLKKRITELEMKLKNQ